MHIYLFIYSMFTYTRIVLDANTYILCVYIYIYHDTWNSKTLIHTTNKSNFWSHVNMHKYAQQKSHAQILCRRDGEHAMLAIPNACTLHAQTLSRAHVHSHTHNQRKSGASHTHASTGQHTRKRTHKHENKGMSTHTIRICTHSWIVGAHYTQDYNGWLVDSDLHECDV